MALRVVYGITSMTREDVAMVAMPMITKGASLEDIQALRAEVADA